MKKEAKKRGRIARFVFPATTCVSNSMDEMVKDNPLAFFFLVFVGLPWIFLAFMVDICYIAAIVLASRAAAWGINHLVHWV